MRMLPCRKREARTKEFVGSRSENEGGADMPRDKHRRLEKKIQAQTVEKCVECRPRNIKSDPIHGVRENLRALKAGLPPQKLPE